MTEVAREIVCHLQNDPRLLMMVEASMDLTVFELKGLVKENRKNGALRNVDSDALVLWKLKVPQPIKPMETLRERLNFKDLSLSAEELEPCDIVSDIFPEPISINAVHIIVSLSPDGAHYSLVPSITAKLRADRIKYAERFLARGSLSYPGMPRAFISAQTRSGEPAFTYFDGAAESITAKLRADRIKYDKRRPMGSPSYLGMPKAFISAQTSYEEPAFNFDRPPTAAGTIPDDCANHNPVEEDTKLALEMSSVMANFYDSDEKRMSTFRTTMAHNHFEMYATLIKGTDFVTNGDIRSFGFCLVEGKNEIGSHGADPIFQAAACYVKIMAEASKEHPRARLPAILMYIMGAHIGFVGAVYTTKPNLQVLVNPLALFPHHTDIEIRTAAARYFGALRKAVHSLHEYYKSFPSTIDSSDNPELPYCRKYTSLIDGTTHSFIYKVQLHEKLIFFSEGDDGHKLCVKFVHTYSQDAHSACAKMGFAPTLRGFEKLPGNWYMVVMDEIDSSFHHFNAESHSNLALYKHLKQKLTDLHLKNFVHGDIRDVNLLVKEGDDEHPLLVDFDWAGLIGKAKYPLYINRADIWRPDGAQDGNLILADHDISMLDRIFGEMSLE